MRALMLHATGKEGAPGAAPSIHMGGQASSSSSSSSWSGACVALAFRSLKLIVDDFLEVSVCGVWERWDFYSTLFNTL